MGVVQGSVLSPQLFNIYLEEALLSNDTLRNKYQHGGLLAYADDLVATFASKDEADRIIGAIETLKQTWGLQLNKEKSVILAELDVNHI